MTSPAPTLPQRRYDCLDGLRAVLAIYVVMHHLWIGLFLSHPGALSPAFLVLAFGRYAVCFFLVLSGFCLMLPVLRDDLRLGRGTGSFLRRRAWRILPPYYFALALSIAVALPINRLKGTLWSMFLPVTWSNALSHLLLVHNFMPAHMYRINGAFWSIPIEWQIYFVFPLLLLGWRRAGPWLATALAIGVSVLIEIEINRRFMRQPGAHFIGLFALGMLAAYLAESARFPRVPWRSLVVVAGAGFAAAFWVNNPILLDVTFGAVASLVLVVMLLYPHGWLHRGLAWKPLVFVGSFSYSIYLVHAPLLLIFWVTVVDGPQPHLNRLLLIMLAGCTPLAVGFSYLFHLACEKPFLRVPGRKVVHIE